MNYTENQPQGDVLTDKSSTGRERPWRAKKMANELLSLAYAEVDPKKAVRLKECAKTLIFRLYPDGSKKLHGMTSCRVRLCPVCAWRRSLKVYYNSQRIVDYINRQYGYSYIFLTLTVKNCEGEALAGTLSEILQAWGRLTRLDPVTAVCKGWYRGLEITHNVELNTEGYNTYHPHIHALIAVPKSYFTDTRRYLSQERWTELWKQSARLDYTPIVDVRRVYGTDGKAIAEAAKYAVKDADYIIPEDWDLTIETVRLLDKALDKRRFVAYGGVMREVKQILALEDEESGSLVDVGEESENQGDDFRLIAYAWYTGYNQFFRVE